MCVISDLQDDFYKDEEDDEEEQEDFVFERAKKVDGFEFEDQVNVVGNYTLSVNFAKLGNEEL